MKTEILTESERIALEDAKFCTGYHGAASVGAGLSHQRALMWRNHERLAPMIHRAFRDCATGHGEALAPNRPRPAAQEIDSAVSCFRAQLDIIQALCFDGFESLAGAIRHDKIHEEGLD